MANNLTTFVCRLSRNLGASTSWNRKGLSRPVMGLLLLSVQAEWFGVRSLAGATESSLPPQTYRPFLESIQPPVRWVPGVLSGREAEVTNEWSISHSPYTPSCCVQCKPLSLHLFQSPRTKSTEIGFQAKALI
jgi:hypothetical protein